MIGFIRNVSVRTNPYLVCDRSLMPPKIRELIALLERAGFENRGGRGSHRNFIHPKLPRPITISGNLADEAKRYQERAVAKAIQEAKS